MKYLTLHETKEDYLNLVLDETNTPHVAYVIDENCVYFTDSINATIPDGYQSFEIGDDKLIDNEDKQFVVKQ